MFKEIVLHFNPNRRSLGVLVHLPKFVYFTIIHPLNISRLVTYLIIFLFLRLSFVLFVRLSYPHSFVFSSPIAQESYEITPHGIFHFYLWLKQWSSCVIFINVYIYIQNMFLFIILDAVEGLGA